MQHGHGRKIPSKSQEQTERKAHDRRIQALHHVSVIEPEQKRGQARRQEKGFFLFIPLPAHQKDPVKRHSAENHLLRKRPENAVDQNPERQGHLPRPRTGRCRRRICGHRPAPCQEDIQKHRQREDPSRRGKDPVCSSRKLPGESHFSIRHPENQRKGRRHGDRRRHRRHIRRMDRKPGHPLCTCSLRVPLHSQLQERCQNLIYHGKYCHRQNRPGCFLSHYLLPR